MENIENISGIYKIQSAINSERTYIGSSVNISNRWSKHLSNLKFHKHPNKKLQNHYNKYGIEDFEFSVLVECEKEKLIELEQYYIDLYKPWFNIRLIAESNLGYKFSEESKKKMSLAQIGKHSYKMNNEQKINSGRKKGCTAWNKGKKMPPMSEELKLKISKANKGRKSTSNPRIYTDEDRKKISERLKGVNTWMKGRKLSEATREKLRLAWAERKKKKLLLED